MELTIFNVEHGQCSLIETSMGGFMLIDCGHNSTSGWRPSTFFPQIGVTEIDRLFITNSDEDHASDLHNLRSKVTIKSLNRNPTVTSSNIRQLKSQDVGLGITSLCEMLDEYTHPLAPNAKIDDINYRSFHNRYPDDFEDENNLSVVTFFKLEGHTVCFTGDMTAAGFKVLLQKPDFRIGLAETTIFFASHHGREDGCCEELYTVGGLDPIVTIISDSGMQHATQETISWYRARTKGFQYDGRTRRVLTTRSDGNIRFSFNASGAEAFLQVAV